MAPRLEVIPQSLKRKFFYLFFLIGILSTAIILMLTVAELLPEPLALREDIYIDLNSGREKYVTRLFGVKLKEVVIRPPFTAVLKEAGLLKESVTPNWQPVGSRIYRPLGRRYVEGPYGRCNSAKESATIWMEYACHKKGISIPGKKKILKKIYESLKKGDWVGVLLEAAKLKEKIMNSS